MSNETQNLEQATTPSNLAQLSDEALDDLISGNAQEMSNTQAWE